MGDFYGMELNDAEYTTVPYVDINDMSWREESDHSQGAVVSVDTGDEDTRLDLAIGPEDYDNREEWASVLYQLEEKWDELRWFNAA